MEPVESVLKADEKLILQDARKRCSSDTQSLVKIIDRLATRVEEFEAGQVTPRGRVFRNVAEK